MIKRDGNIDTGSEEVKRWTPAFENYTFAEKDRVTKIQVDQDISDEYREAFSDMWPKALLALKELAEKS